MNGNRIKQLRKNAGLTQAELGEKLGVVKQTVSSWENNISEPNGDTLIQMSKILDTSPAYLFGEDSTVETDKIHIPEQLNTSIKYWVAKTGYSYSEIAHKIGIPENVFMDYVNEHIDIPYSILISLSEICDVSTDCLLGMINKSRKRDLNNTLPFQYNYEIARRIRKLCEETNTESSFLETLLSMTDREVFYLIEYGFVTHMDIIIKLAQFFHVSTDYLLCLIDEQDEKVLITFRQLNEDNKDIIVGEMKKCLKEQRYESVAADPTLKKTGTDNMGK